MKYFLRIPLFLFVLFLLCFCKKENTQSQKEPLVIGHRATGHGVQGGFIENTLPAVKEALKYADGVEQDIQMSSDGTIWIYHDALFDHLCAGNEGTDSLWKCIPTTPDSVISDIKLCREGVQSRIFKLEELFELYRDYPNKYLSLDVKGYFDEACISTLNVSNTYLEGLANGLYALMDEYDMHDRVFVETNYTRLFEVLKEKDPKIICTLLGYEDLNEKLNRSIENQWDGISFNFSDSTATVANARRVVEADQLLQLWTIYGAEGYRNALELHPTTIQVSELELLKSIYQKRKPPRD